jgi:periplasmic protein TonB
MHMKVPAKDRILAWAIGTSIVLHGVILTVHFTFPNALRWQAPDNRLEVVLVNAKTKERPSKADVLAQSNLDRGGNVDERRRARSPLPVTEPRDPGKDLAQAQKRVQELEARQQALLAQAREAQARAAAEAQKNPAPEQRPQSGRDMADLALAAMRLQAQIDTQLKEYQERPRKKFIGANAAEYRFAQYEEDWRAKIERWGTVNYPAEARGRHYGNLRLTVTIRPDGSVESVELDRSSGLKVLDAAAFKIVKMAQPFAAFPPAIRKDTDLLVITRTWFFGRGDKLWTE